MIRPILFNGDMVRAILEGRKIVTRRCVKSKSKNACGFFVTTRKSDGAFMGVYDSDENEMMYESPQAQPAYVGDILYVRETWQECCRYTVNSPIIHNKYCFKASIDSAHYGCIEDCGKICNWKPSIHMPKEAARIFLKVTDVRVERLQDITDEQTEAEGFQFTPPCLSKVSEDSYCDLDGPCTNKIKYCDMSAGELFGKVLWDSTIKKSELDTYGWDANPWVWVIEFERCDKPDEFTGSNN